MKSKKLFTICLVTLLALAVLTGCAQTSPDAQPDPAPAVELDTPEPDTPEPDESEVDEPEAEEPALEPVELLIGAAMSLVDVVEVLSEIYMTENPHVSILHNFASSGALQGQIEEGAPIDIFFSAAAAQMNNLEEQGLIYGTGSPVVRNTVALIVPAASDIAIESFADVASDAVSIVGVGDPEAMPIGRFAEEVFTELGVADEVYEKATLASDVRQILTWVEMAEVDAGVVFMTDAITSDDVRVVEVADAALHSPSVNPVGIVERSEHIDEAQAFIEFLFSSYARSIFEGFGFEMYN